MIGTRRPSLHRRQRSKPFFPGIITSTMARSGANDRAALTALMPSPTAWTLKPSKVRLSVNTPARPASSSTIRMRCFTLHPRVRQFQRDGGADALLAGYREGSGMIRDDAFHDRQSETTATGNSTLAPEKPVRHAW